MITVAIVDDHPLFRAGLRDAIDGQVDLEVVAEHSTAEEAVAALSSDPVNIVLMDLQMPGCGGAAGTAALMQLDDPPKVVVLTTFSSDADIVAALDAGARGYVLKDAPPEDVFAAIRRVHAGGTVLAPSVAARVVDGVREAVTQLTDRELEVVHLLGNGLGNRAIAQRLHVSEATVKTHLTHIYKKLEVDSRTAAIVEARQRGILE